MGLFTYKHQGRMVSLALSKFTKFSFESQRWYAVNDLGMVEQFPTERIAKDFYREWKRYWNGNGLRRVDQR